MEEMNRECPLVSVITVCYNSEKTIERTILSVVNQTYPNIEYIIVDGLSSDHTRNIIERYADQYKNVKWVSEADQGIYDAMNKGIAMSTGDIIGILNSDDWYEIDAVETVVERYRSEHGKMAVYYGMLSLYQDGMERSCLFYHHNFLPETMINHPACFVTKSIYEKYGMFDLEYKVVADYDFMLRLYYIDKVNLFVPIHKILANFSIGSVSGTIVSLCETEKVQCKYGIISPTQVKKRVLVRKIKQLFRY